MTRVLFQTILTLLYPNNRSLLEIRTKALLIKRDLKQYLQALTQIALDQKYTILYRMISKERQIIYLHQKTHSFLNIACISKSLNSSIILLGFKLRISSSIMSIQMSSSSISKISSKTVDISTSNLRAILSLALQKESSVPPLIIVHYKITANLDNNQSLLNLRWWCCNWIKITYRHLQSQYSLNKIH